MYPLKYIKSILPDRKKIAILENSLECEWVVVISVGWGDKRRDYGLFGEHV